MLRCLCQVRPLFQHQSFQNHTKTKHVSKYWRQKYTMCNLKTYWLTATGRNIRLHWKWQKSSFPLVGSIRVVRWENIFLSNLGAWGPSGSLVLQPDPKACTEEALMAVGVLPPLTGPLARNTKECSTLTWCTLRKKTNWQRHQRN